MDRNCNKAYSWLDLLILLQGILHVAATLIYERVALQGIWKAL
jgi:hypothetical protein